MGSTPGYVTVLVALISSLGALAGVWLTAARTDKRSAQERDDRRFEKAKELQEERFAKFLVPARRLTSALDSPGSVLEPLREAAAHIELHEPDLADGPVRAVLDAADRLLLVRRRNSAGSQVVVEAETEYRDAVAAVRGSMKERLDAA
ncbi:hypothetical protein F1721_12920 [Saccharopolyspora hirsuta]|uniref:Uncharacterized protein n=1 Tax=Saccharopolyspora hirsuta TaxID=1837 RepID=A0A5M7BYK1_SACHI|nr:hypothetical protein [Saccharopolyspora hirsuta]KAA5834563.1 hypothetical protein F1721_12920 [Saccharopolyspora hirsuta]